MCYSVEIPECCTIRWLRKNNSSIRKFESSSVALHDVGLEGYGMRQVLARVLNGSYAR